MPYFMLQSGRGGPEADGSVWVEVQIWDRGQLRRVMECDQDGVPLVGSDGKGVRQKMPPEPFCTSRTSGQPGWGQEQWLAKVDADAHTAVVNQQALLAARAAADAFLNVPRDVPGGDIEDAAWSTHSW